MNVELVGCERCRIKAMNKTPDHNPSIPKYDVIAGVGLVDCTVSGF